MSEVEYRCFVGGLAWATNDEDLQRTFSQFGDVIDSKIINDRESGRSRGFGFVTFKDEKAMRDAIEEMNGSGGGGGGRGYGGGGRREGGGYGGGDGGSYGGGGGGW
ncbi:cold, circadian rhythm, and RNA binding 1 [Arabidopsis thaliana]|uniref:Cold, circadian rhythm, and RNA binding 1 n=1 Tax=Arabidopsis thaliana TaxID=3702 RepID=F4JVB9_ARATH|nr:cold, circadian rhythm, and RNA binding 1 [Arabidopsis thaliana]AEE87047.1 cold, circadian rhythm, and RNA binding 1 [Arabidopsis thaliana]|eukprot:NP_849525.1 cold, circadian rhythm, and RNA binding 1 [Arabidopsis thaliana]